ncbi:MAG: hypothetical protein RMI34_05455 [Chloroherpetonaceae bacterium]|nr:hypothetical protein [Chloroherpetonaceae bacterium]MCS7210762.1 hypothetical protein [Chloroherpetonaceae bacterium]MDW8019506.1 hypothetical protein [Chloroherpetonaceae bacterium]
MIEVGLRNRYFGKARVENKKASPIWKGSRVKRLLDTTPFGATFERLAAESL